MSFHLYTLPGIYITSLIYLYKSFIIYISLAVYKFKLSITTNYFMAIDCYILSIYSVPLYSGDK